MAEQNESTPKLWLQRFWEKVDRRGPDECWPWLGFLDGSGYGHFQRPSDRVDPTGRRRIRHPGAHRVSYELAKGLIPVGLVVRHKCDYPPCVNPAHLFIGTRSDNNTERKEKGRNILSAPRPRWTPARSFANGVYSRPVNERLQEAVIIHPLTSCWVWQRGLLAQGYGEISVQGKMRKAHRLAWETWVGPIPDGMDILHSCDNRACINVNHLRPGTDKDNTADRYARGRSPTGKDHHFHHNKFVLRGEASANSKLTDEAVRLIRAGMTTKEAMRSFGVTGATVAKARSGFTWAHHKSPVPFIRKMGPKQIINAADVELIRRTNMPTCEIVRRFKVSRSTALRARGADY